MAYDLFNSPGIRYLTDNTEQERKEVLHLLAGQNTIPAGLDHIYPALGAYLSDYAYPAHGDNVLAEILTKYFSEYRRLKVTNRLDPVFKSRVEELARQRPYVTLPSRGAILEKLSGKGSYLCWVDAMGVEFLPYVQQRAFTLGLDASVQVGRASIPTLTKTNRSFFDEWPADMRRKVSQLDSLKHGKEDDKRPSRENASYVALELSIMEDVLRQERDRLRKGGVAKVILTSDHGASRLAVLADSQNKWKMATTGVYSGRCCPKDEVSERPWCAMDGADGKHDFWALANYDRFQGGKASCGEVHGGATLEEMVVPIVTLTLRGAGPVVQVLDPIASYNSVTGEAPRLRLHVTGGSQVEVAYAGRRHRASALGHGMYEVTLAGVRRADEKARAQVYVDGKAAQDIAFAIQSQGLSVVAEDDDFF